MQQPDSPTKSDFPPQPPENQQQEDNQSIESEEEIPQAEYEELVKAMQEKKAKDQQDQVEGRQSFDYTVPKTRPRKRIPSTVLESRKSIPPSYNDQIEPQVIVWIRQKLESTLLMFDQTKHWNKDLQQKIRNIILLKDEPRLYIWIENDKLYFSSESDAAGQQTDMALFYNFAHQIVTQRDLEMKILIRLIQKNKLKSLLQFMNTAFIPSIMTESSWPDNVKKEFLTQLHKFMISMTESCFQKEGYTELYIPKEDLTLGDGQDKDLIKRLQTIIIQWNRQIKEIVSNSDSHQENQNSGPLDEIQYWRNRRENLKHIDEQLENEELKRIVRFLEKNESNDAKGFGQLAAHIKNKSEQATNNLIFLESLSGPCQQLQMAEPKQIPDLLPETLKRIRMIWQHSKYYNSSERVSGLLYKISNQVIQRCKAKINIDDMLDGDVENCMQDLNDAIECGKKWRQIYDRILEIINKEPGKKWDFSSNSIFASVQAFIQRCSELIQICQGQLQFALKGRNSILPKFGGSKAQQIVAILQQIKGSFGKLIQKFKTSKKEKILDVKASNWHDQYNAFKSGVKQLDVMYQNVIDFAFKQVTTVQQGVYMLQAFDYLAKRDSIRTCVKKKAIEVMNLFINEIDGAKQELQQKKSINYPLNHGEFSGVAILIRSIIFRLEKFKEKVDKLYFVQESIKAPAFEKYMTTVKQLESMIKDQKLALWKEQNKVFEEPGNLSKSIESVTILCRPDEHHEDYKLKEILRPKPRHIQCNFDRKLMKLINQVAAWKILIPFNIRIPNDYDEFVMNHRQNLRVLRQYAMVVVRQYNQIIDYMDENERNLFAQHLQSTDKVIQPGINRYKWSSKTNVDSFLGRSCRGSCHDLYHKLKEFKSNTEKIDQKCQQIANKQFLSINKKKSYLIAEFEQQQEKHRKQIKVKLNDILREICEILANSYELFSNGRKQTQTFWFQYVKEVDKKIEEALKKGIKNSLVEFYMVIGDQDKNIQPIPIFIISAILQRDDPPKLAYKPTTLSLLQTITQIISSINDVVSGFLKIHNKMYDIYKTKRAQILVRMQKQKNPNRKVFEEQELKFIESNNYYKISDDSDIQKYSQKILNNLHKWCNEVTKDSTKDKWTNSPLFWQNQKKQKFITKSIDQNWTYISQLREQIQNSNTQSQQIQEIKSSHPIGCIILDDSSFKQTLSEIVILWQNMFMSYLQQRCVHELKSLHELFITSQANLTPEPQDLHELKKNTDLWQQLMNNKEDVEKKLEPLKDKFAQLDAHSIQLKEEQNKLRASLMDAWMHYNQMLLEIEKRNEKVRSNFHYQATKNLQDFLKQALDLKNDFEINAPLGSSYTNQQAFSLLNDYNQSVQTLRNRWNDMIFGFKLFDISVINPADLDYVDKEIKNLQAIWTLKEEWDQKYIREVKDLKFKQINTQTLEQYAEDFVYKLNSLSKQTHVKKWGIVTAFKASIQNFKIILPLIENLRKPFIRGRHWDELRSHFDVDPESDKFTFDEMYVQKNFIGYAEIINNTCDVARQEYKIQSALQKIKKEWQGLDISVQPHKKTYKLKGTDVIFAVLQEHMGILSNQKTGLFYENFKDEIELWENNLQRISQTLQMLTQVQRQWIYLEAIFASQQDQDRQLIGDINKFQSLNSRISAHMDRINHNKNILAALLVENFYNDLDDISKRLDESQKVLFSLLETKRGGFPRFYFLANDDLFELLGNSKDPGKVNKHIKKCFEGIKKLNIVGIPVPGKRAQNTNFEVIDLISPEDETVRLVNKVSVENGVESWLKNTQRQMRQSLKKSLFLTYTSFCKKKDSKLIGEWIQNPGHQGQLLIVASQIHWTTDCENILRSIMNSQKPDKGKAWKSLKDEKSFFLTQLTKQVRKATKNLIRLKLIALITIEVHARDITDILSKTCFSPNSFEWKKQLRFKASLQGESLECTVDQTNTSFPYGYEYQGNNGRLVVTALTDRCYMTLTTAMHLKKGGAPQGPAGTGKTETVKDLGKGLAKFVLVFNCSQGLDYKSLGRMFSGLMQTGGWGCFDEFNRIELEVLSVVAQQMLSILNALKALDNHQGGPQNPFSFVFQGTQIPANDQCAIFITMNPGYAGRSQLPDNLKSLFRPISMMVPQSNIICEIMLSSEGFKYGKMISNKIVVLYQLMSQQLSKQDHYDFGLRAIKSVLTCAGAIRRDTNIESPLDKIDKKDKQMLKQLEQQELNQQVIILMKAIRDMNLPKFVEEDIPLFNSLFSDLFPNIEVQQATNEQFQAAIEKEIKRMQLVVKPEQVKKIIQLYDSKNTRHGNMLVGISQSGKSTIWKVLHNTLNALSKQNKKYPGVKYEYLNPKSIDLKELFGYVDGNLEWHQGVLSSMMSRLCKQESDNQRWMILDGPVDTLWIESMNTVLDDNKVLTLLNGDRISLPSQVGLIFEVEDLAVASPATVSRAGMVFVNINDLGWRPFIKSWVSKKKDQQVQEFLNQLIEKWFAKLFAKKQHMKDEFKEHVPSLQISIMIAFTKLLDSFVHGDAKAADFNIQNKTQTYWGALQKWFTFCMIWAFGGTLDQTGRKTFDLVIRDIESMFPGNYTVFDYYINPDKNEWQGWQEKVNSIVWKPPPTASYHSLVVPTVDSQRTKYVLQNCVNHKIHTLSVGVTGTGKTVLINQILNQLDQNSWKITNIIFSSQTSSLKTQDMIEGKMTRRTKTKMVPDGKKMIIYVDDLNMPKKDTYGSQPPLQLLRQWMDYGGWFDRVQNEIFKKIEDVQFIASMGPPGGGRNEISRRIQTKFVMINFTFPSESQVRRIFHNILQHKFFTQDFDDQIKQVAQTLAMATISLYNSIADTFLPTPAKSHYVFNMRDISKVIQGIYIFDKFYCDSKLTIYRLWVHQAMRVFHDRLVSVEDRMKLKKLISDQLESTLQSNIKECTDHEQNDSIFVDFFDESQSRQIYIEVPFKQREQLKKLVEDKLNQFNEKFKSAAMNITLFDEAISYVCKINRIIKFAKGHGMLVGQGGAGRHSLTKLATFIAKYNLCQITASKGFKLKDFRQKIKQWSQECAFKDNTSSVFMFSDNQITQESFVEDINTILTIGEIPNLFGKEDLPNIKEKMKKVVARMMRDANPNGKEIKQFKDEVLMAEFYSRIQNNFHIVFLMSKTGDNLRNYGRMYPGLVNNTTIVWFMPWPAEALVEVANNSIKEFNFDEDTRRHIAQYFGNAHTKVIELADKMFKELKRLYYVTPTNYIELVKGYCELLNNKRAQIGGQIEKLGGGLGKLDEAQSNSNQLQKNLAVFQNQLGKKSKDCEQLMIKIDKETRESNDKKNEVVERRAQVSKEKQQMQMLKADAQADLKKAEPALQAAEQGLANLTKDKLSVVKSYTTPPGGVDVVLNAVMILLNKEPSWAVAKKELADTSFLQRLQTIDKGRIPTNTLKRIQKLTQDPKMQISRIDTISEAAGGLWRWVLAVEGYAKAFKDIEPKKNKVNNLMQKLKRSEDELQTLQDNFAKVQQAINNLTEQLQKAKSDMDTYKQQTDQLQIKLQRAEKLITGLASTKQGWRDRKEKLQEKYSYIVGDSLITAAFQSYCGPFPSEFREDLNSNLHNKIKALKIPYSKDYNFPEFLVKPVQFIKWNLKGLPDDQFSKENGVLVRKGRMFPLLIDPQLQGNRWIRQMEKQNKDKFIILDPKTENYMKTIEMAIANGHTVLLQNLQEQIDSSLEPLLNKTIKKVADRFMIYLGDKDIRYNENFRFYMTTKLPNPRYKPEVTTKVLLVNFTVKQKGLEEQLTSVVIQKMQVQLQTNKNQLIKNKSENEQKMKKIDDKILQILSESKTSLIDDENIITFLQQSKQTEEKVKTQIESSINQMKKILAARQNYKKLAKIASKLFFIINDFALIETMYQFSLDAYIGLFSKTIKQYIEKPGLNDSLNEKLDAIAEKLKTGIYRYACRGLFEKDKLLLGFMMTVKLKQVDPEEYNFFLKGGREIIDRKNQPINPNEWIEPQNWNAICDLEKLPNFANIITSFIHNAKQWKKWYMSATPEKEPLPGEWNQKCDSLRKLIITKIVRRDRVLPAVINFIIDKNGNETFVHPPNFSLQSVYSDSNKNTPIIFVLSPGVDPYSQLEAFAREKKVELVPVSLGQGQAKKAKDKVNEGAKNGSWLYLANCHLSLGFLKDLQKMLQNFEMNKNDVDDRFRLWLSTNPHPQFPISILQRCLKITTEPPKGLKANMLRLYTNLPNKEIEGEKMDPQFKPFYKRILFSLCWYHALIIERKRFKTLGWNIIYDFNDSDWDTANNILQIYITHTQEVKLGQTSVMGEQPQVIKQPPWEAIRYLISEVTYGGRVTDQWDRRLLNVYAMEYFNQMVITQEKHRLGNPNSGQYIIPEEQPPKEKNHESQPKYYMRKIEQFPTVEKPDVFGQHINAQISSQIADTNILIESLQALESSQANESQVTLQAKVKEIIREMLQQVDEPFNEEEVFEKVKPEDQNPLKIVLLQEISRYNKLLKLVKKNLIDLEKGINGLVLISQDLQKVMFSLYENKVPEKWKFAYYSLKPLSMWMKDLNKRIDQLRQWANKGQPNVFWIPGFSFPTGFTTALQQQASRKSNIPIDQFIWEFSFEKYDTSITSAAKEGAYISGLFLEGARWDGDKNCITEPQPMKLNYRMPIIQFKPTPMEGKQKVKKGQNLYSCPTYMYPIRTGVREKPSYMFTVMLPIKPGVNTTNQSDQDFWTKRGVALLMSLAGEEI